MIRGYSGYYKGFYLRSSYEYAFAKYLDDRKIDWKYEQKSFDLNGEIYVPDFFIYRNNSFLGVVEVKSNKSEEIQKGKEKLQKLEKYYFIKGELISLSELNRLYKEQYKDNSKLNKVLKEWKENKNNKLYSSIWDENGNLSKEQITIMKKTISKQTKQRWKNPEMKEKMLEGALKGALTLKNRKGKWFKVEREKRNCAKCGKEFVVIKTSSQKYCSTKCPSEIGAVMAKELIDKENAAKSEAIKQITHQWIVGKEKKILNTKFNRIGNTLNSLVDEIYNELGIRDIRTITKHLIGKEKGRKDLLQYLKNLCEKDRLQPIKDENNPRLKIKLFMEKWALENASHLNKSNVTNSRKVLLPLAKEIEKKFGYKIDTKLRILQRALFGKDVGYTNVLIYLKNFVKNN